MIFNVPWWIIIIGVCILLSGYMAYRAFRAERELEQQFIEKEGSVYIKRMENERKTRHQA